MELMYLVSYFRHNKTTGGNAYKTELATRDLDEAKQKFHALCGEYFEKPTFDFVSVSITDSYGNPVMSDVYEEKKEEPEAE